MVIKAVATVGVILLLVLMVVPAFRFSTVSPHVRILLELEQLENALLMYQTKNGELFPNAGDEMMFQHLRRINPQATGISESFDSRKLDPKSLDDAEMLVLFLGEAADENLGRRGECFFDFPTDRLKDSDGDGWLEFASIMREGLFATLVAIPWFIVRRCARG